MNRQERRRTMREYKKMVRKLAKKAVDGFEAQMKSKWEQSDEDLNDGEVVDQDDGEDDQYNA